MAQPEQQHEIIEGASTLYLGRVDFGKGAIDAKWLSEEAFMGQLKYVASSCLMFVPDYRQKFGGCMDGRGNIMDLLGNPVAPRPKVIGAPSVFGHQVASIGNFSILAGVEDPMEQFVIVNEAMVKAGLRLGMHTNCGAAMGAKPVAENLVETYDNINGLMPTRSRRIAEKRPELLDDILVGAKRNHTNIARATDYTQDNMMQVIIRLDGEEAVIKLKEEHDHHAHGHREGALGFIDVDNAVVMKDKFIREQDGAQMFWQNMHYASTIIQALANTQTELQKGLIVAGQYPLAGVATLGDGQHVGEINDFELAA